PVLPVPIAVPSPATTAVPLGATSSATPAPVIITTPCITLAPVTAAPANPPAPAPKASVATAQPATQAAPDKQTAIEKIINRSMPTTGAVQTAPSMPTGTPTVTSTVQSKAPLKPIAADAQHAAHDETPPSAAPMNVSPVPVNTTTQAMASPYALVPTTG